MLFFVNKMRQFLNSNYFPLLVFFLILVSHTFSMEPLCIGIVLFFAFLGLLICDDLKFLISPLVMFIFAFSQKSVASGKFFTNSYMVAIIVLSCILAAFLVAHFVIYRKNIRFKNILNSKLFVGYIVLCVAFLVNGLFSFNDYALENISYALILCVSFGLVFFMFYVNLNINDGTKKYIFYTLYLLSVLITLQMFFSFVNQIQFKDGEIVKESILLGWGMWNNIGGILSLLLPIHFYFASTVKRFGICFYFSGLISYLAIALTLSRSSLLVSSFIIVICALISCFYGANKKINRIVTGIITLVGISAIILLWDKISNIFGDYLSRGFDDNGRFDIYKYGLTVFSHNPIFGQGFYTDYKLDYVFIHFLPFRYHNTIIQLLATCGIFGFLSYLFHRYQTIRLIVKSKNLYSTYAGICILALLLCSLLDNHLFNIYPAFIYSILLVAVDKSPRLE